MTSQTERRKKDVIMKQKHLQLEYEDKLAQLTLAHNEFDKWIQSWDEFNDGYYWTHILTGEEIWEQPSIEQYLPHDWVDPAAPAHLAGNETQGFGHAEIL